MHFGDRKDAEDFAVKVKVTLLVSHRTCVL